MRRRAAIRRRRGSRAATSSPDSPAARGAPEAGDQTAWNQDVSHSPVDPRSSAYIDRITALGGNQAIHPDFGGNGRYGIPYNVVGRDQQRYPVHSTPTATRVTPAPIRSRRTRRWSAAPTATCSRSSATAAACTSSSALTSTPPAAAGSRPPARPSTSTARVPSAPTDGRRPTPPGSRSLPGLVRPGEVAHGTVRHAIRVTFEETRKAYIHPATHYASDQCDPDLPPMGLRLRLRPGYFKRNLDRFAPGSQARTIFVALYHYGIINADNGGNWFITGAASKRWDDGDLDALKTVPGRAFVVVQAGRIHTPC